RRTLYADRTQGTEGDDPLEGPIMAQPALIAIEYALAQTLIAWGVRPDAMLGHSLGEYTAACLAGVLSLEELLTLAATRARLMHALPPGAMLAIACPAEEVHPLLGDEISIACVNSPRQCIAAGPPTRIQRLAKELLRRNVAHRMLRTSRAFHSSMVEPILDAFATAIRSVRLRPPQIPYISNVTGTWISDDEATNPDYWVAHTRGCVQFATGVRTLANMSRSVMVEVGPGRALTALVRDTCGEAAPPMLSGLGRADD